MGRSLAQLWSHTSIRGFETHGSLQQRRPVYEVERGFRHVVANVAIGVEKTLYTMRQGLLRLPEYVALIDGLAVLLDLFDSCGRKLQERVVAHEQLVLQPQRVSPAHPFSRVLTRPQPQPGLNERAVEAEVDLGDARDGRELSIVVGVVGAERANIVESSRLEANEVTTFDQVGVAATFFLRRQNGFIEAGGQHVDEINI